MAVHCPNCGSGRTLASAALHAQETIDTQGRSGGVWLTSRGRAGAWQGSRSSTRQSRAAAQNAPPFNMLPAIGAAVVFFVTTNLLAWAGAPLLLVIVTPMPIAITVVILGYRASSESDQTVRQHYDNQWYCRQCGTKFHRSIEFEAVRSLPTTASTTTSGGPMSTGFAPYLERVMDPVQRARAETERDYAGLKQIFRRCDEHRRFDPLWPTPLDLGIVSRLASLAYIEPAECSGKLQLTRKAVERLS